MRLDPKRFPALQKILGASKKTLTIPDAIRQLRDEWKKTHNLTPYQIDDGNCSEFATELLILLGCSPYDKVEHDIYELTNKNAMLNFGDDGEWDWPLLKKLWNITPPDGLTEKQVDQVDFGYHIWICDGKKHYDAECPDGVENFFDLPIFKKAIAIDVRRGGGKS